MASEAENEDSARPKSRSTLERENEYLAGEIAKLESEMQKRLPSEAEMAYIRERIRSDENAAWLWQQIRKHAPWVVTLGSLVGTAIIWLVTHTINIGPKP